MKTKTLAPAIILIFNFLLVASFSFAQWEIQYPIPTDNHLEDVFFVDDMNGWAVGDNGTIIFTTDGGFSWDSQFSGTSDRLRSVVFTDSQTGWIVGGETHPIPGHYIILHTSNGGNNWILQDLDSTNCLRDVFFLDSENGWAVGYRNCILHTSDGGNNWNTQLSGTGYSTMYEVFFTDPIHGWVASDNGLFNTNDGGLNWNVHIQGNFESIYFVNQDVGWVSTFVYGYMSSSGILLHSTDAFNTWDTINQCPAGEESSCGYYSIYFKDSNTGWMLYYGCYSGGWAGGCSYALIKTADGGMSWENIDLPASRGLRALHFTAEGKGSIVGSHGVVMNTTNWEDQWSLTSQGNYLWFYSIDFSDHVHGWAAGSEGFSSWWGGIGSSIVHTDDGGISWLEQNSPISGPIEAVKAINLNTAWAVGNSNDTNFIINTTNAGKDWIINRWDTGYHLNSVCFTNESNGWAVGAHYDNSAGTSEGRILKTGDGGNNWEQQFCDTCQELRNVFFVDQNTGWAIGNSIYKTTNGGENWILQEFDNNGFTLVDLCFFSENEGWVVGNKDSGHGILLHTTDGGNNWLVDVQYSSLFSIHFKDQYNGIISGRFGLILHTSDGGVTWEQQDSGTDNTLYSVCYTSVGNAFAAGMWGTIVHSSPFTTSVFENTSENKFATDLQCLPNPFSETTTLSFSLFQKSEVSIKIYNNQGQLVFNERFSSKPEGRHEILLYGKDLPSGIYFCSLQTNPAGAGQTRKIIKL